MLLVEELFNYPNYKEALCFDPSSYQPTVAAAGHFS